ncbi:MAG: helix-turn-helix domain-containing protein [Burkholderiales bacterium]|nr:helix-turn-helix domain-containing protein [Burkholderiales bacterium]
MSLFQKIANPREIRQKLGLNQEEFWQKIGVTQSGGSRYEAGRDMPKPVTELLRLVHLEGVDLSSVRKEDIQIIEFLRDKHPDLYNKLRDAVSDSGDARGSSSTSSPF